MSSFDWIADELAALDRSSLRRQPREVHLLPAGRCQLNGKTLWNFASNDYLGLASHPEVVAAAQMAVGEGVGARASSIVTGRTQWHAQLEQKLAEFKGTAAAMLFPSGYAANFGTIVALVGADDVVFCDRLNHASLVDGARSSKARFRLFGHRDLAALERELSHAGGYRRRLIVTDSLFSMDGDLAPLDKLAALADQYNAMLLVDEAHATGIFGSHGTGALEQLAVESPNVVTVGTLSKAIGSQGGFVAASAEICDWLWNKARTSMYSTALAIPACAAALSALDVMQREPQRRHWLLENSERVQLELRAQGWTIPADVIGPIIPVILKDSKVALEQSARMQEQGLLIPAIRPPTVPRKSSRLRISLSYAHGEEGIEALLSTFQRLSR